MITDDGTRRLTIPADLDETMMKIMRETAISAYLTLGCKGLALLDLYYTDKEGVLIGEVNTMPVLSEDASYPQLMADLGMRYPYLIRKLIEQANEHADCAF